jgi:hypothetical protein
MFFGQQKGHFSDTGLLIVGTIAATAVAAVVAAAFRRWWGRRATATTKSRRGRMEHPGVVWAVMYVGGSVHRVAEA